MRSSAHTMALLLAVPFLLLTVPGAAQSRSTLRQKLGNPSGALTVEQTYVDNLFDEGSQVQSRPDLFTTLRADLRRESTRALPVSIAASIAGEIHRSVHAANYFAYSLQMQRKLGWMTPLVYYRGSPRRLLFIAEAVPPGSPPRSKDVLYRQNVAGMEVKTTFFRHLRLALGYESELRDYRPPFRGRDFTSYHPRLEGRLLAWALFSPRVDVGYEIQDTSAAAQERRGLKVLAGFDGQWGDAVNWGFRWDLTRWKYNAAPPRNKNFERRDERNAFLVHMGVRLFRGASFLVRYRFLDGASTRPDRNFTKNEVTAGFSYAF